MFVTIFQLKWAGMWTVEEVKYFFSFDFGFVQKQIHPKNTQYLEIKLFVCSI